MTQPDNFGFGEEAALLKNSARKFFQDNFPTDRLHRLVAGDPTPERGPQCHWDRELWQQMVDLGWTMLAVPESAGGLGMPVVAVAGLVEELGRAAFPCPLLATLGAGYILAACGDAADEAMEEIAAGRSATLASAGRRGSWRGTGTDVTWQDGRLQGEACFVQDAGKAERLLVAAQAPEGLVLVWVHSDAPGVRVVADALVDLTRDQARVVFDGAQGRVVSTRGQAALDGAFPALWTLLAADMVGAAEWQLQTTVDYVNARTQFDRPLGFFQAVKHPLVDVMLQIDQSKSLVYNAACAIDTEPDRARRFAHMAKASASDAAGFASARSVQCHGGIGFTWECYLHLYFKRQKHSQLLWGDASWHRAQLAELLF